MTIDIDCLDRIWHTMMREPKLAGALSIRIDLDYYWWMDTAAMHDLDATSVDWALGQVYDDWESLRRWLDDTGSVIPYSFTCLSSVTRAVGVSIYLDVDQLPLGECSTIGSLGSEKSLIVSVADLTRLWDNLRNYLRENRIEKITTKIDTYWRIKSSELYNSYAKPIGLVLCDAETVWTHLQMTMEGKIALDLDTFVSMSEMLRIVGDHLV